LVEVKTARGGSLVCVPVAMTTAHTGLCGIRCIELGCRPAAVAMANTHTEEEEGGRLEVCFHAFV
jgi:hypothetical protein